jgi:plastocyanin
MTMRSRLLNASVWLLGLAALPGCGGDSPMTPSPTNTSTINIVGQNGAQAFSPNPASFGGQPVVFKNNDSVGHRIVLNDGTVDTGDIAPGATSRVVTMPPSGTNYHCSIHPGMIGSVTAATGGPPPPCTGSYCDGY